MALQTGSIKERKESSLVLVIEGVKDPVEYQWAPHTAAYCQKFIVGEKVQFDIRDNKISYIKSLGKPTPTTPAPAAAQPPAAQTSGKNTPDPHEPPGGCSPKPWKNETPVEESKKWDPNQPLHPMATMTPEERKSVTNATINKPAYAAPAPAPLNRSRETIKDQKIGLMSCIKTAAHIVHNAIEASDEFLVEENGEKRPALSIDDMVEVVAKKTIYVAEMLDEWMDQRVKEKAEREQHEDKSST